MSVLDIKNLEKSYQSRKVVKNISLHVQSGESVAILGPNGAGKTTCFYMIIGLVKQDNGEIFIDQKNISNLTVYQRARMGIGYLPQEESIFRGLTVAQNILAVLEISEPNKEIRYNRLTSLLKEFDIEHLSSSPSVALSGGERRRLEIARCLATNPIFVLLDEPFAGVDPISVGEIRSIVSKLKSKGIGVLITDHNVRETLKIVDRAYIVYNGSILTEGTPQDIVLHEQTKEFYLGDGFTL